MHKTSSKEVPKQQLKVLGMTFFWQIYNVWTLKFSLGSIVVPEIQNILVLKRLQTYQVSPSVVIILAYLEKIRQTHMSSIIKTL